MKMFALFVFAIGPAACITYCLLGIWENKRAADSIKRFEKQKNARISRGLKALGLDEL